ncbi:MAG: hypothetical protein MK193_05655 [Lentisphaeria bacterium]|nr:hypothetical protein [Lentisphaeria bacterium]
MKSLLKDKFACFLILLTLATGCSSIIDESRLPEDDEDTKSWNQPSEWEQTIPGT